MKILATSDFHGDSRLAEKLAQKAENEGIDMVIICGDITESEQSTDNLIGPFVKRGKKVLLVPGNHEGPATIDFLSEVYNATNLHTTPVISYDIGIFGCGGANIGIHQMTDDETFKMLSDGFEKVKDKKTKIMVTHVHPEGIKMGELTSFFPGSTAVKKAIDTFKPDILVCGHVHEAEGIEEMVGTTRVINVGKKGKVLDIGPND
jgi:uncharacterized protein